MSDNNDESYSGNEVHAKNNLTDAQKARIERNRQKALMLKQARLIPHPCAEIDVHAVERATIKVKESKFIDTGGGFLLEEVKSTDTNNELKITEEPALSIPVTYKECEECNDKFAESYLLQYFDYNVCDNCRDNEDKHSLITRTEAKNEYLLKDCDLDKRVPILKYINRKNPHNSHWGDMKLYLHLQIEKRALEVWGSEEQLLLEKEQRDMNREKSKTKKYNKKLKALRMNVRSSLYDRTSAISHTHAFGPEIYNEDDDTYTHACTTCDYVESFEKM